MPYDVSVIGPLNIDLIITGEGPPDWESIPNWSGSAQMEMTAAGSVGYVVNNLARLGLSVQVSSCLSDDSLGTFILDSLNRVGVDTKLVDRVPNTIGAIAVYMLLFGSRKRPGVWRLPTHPLWKLDFSAEEVETLLDARVLHQGGYLHYKEAWHGAVVELFKEAKARGLTTTMDSQFPLFPMEPPWLVGLEDVLPYVDVFFCDDGEARNITASQTIGEAALRILDAGAKTVIIKRGEQGSTLYRPDWQYHQPAIDLGELVDSIGAGDTYDVGYIYGTLQGWSAEKCALFASLAAGFTVTGVGGSNTMPELERILAEMELHQ